MPIVTQDQIASEEFSPNQEHWLYCGLDNCVTKEVEDKLKEQTSAQIEESYKRTYRMQLPALAMSLRGMRIDMQEQARCSLEFSAEADRMEAYINSMAVAIWKQGLNPRSPHQLKKLFYEYMDLPKQYKVEKGKRTASPIVTGKLE